MKSLLHTGSSLSARSHAQAGGRVPVQSGKRFLINTRFRKVIAPRACCVAFGLLLPAWALEDAAGLDVMVAANGAIRWQGEMVDSNCWALSSRVDESPPDRVARWIKQLGEPTYRTREEASKALLDVGTAAKDQLNTAARDPDPEVAMRAVAVLREIRSCEEKSAKAAPLEVLAPQIPFDIGERNSCLGLLGDVRIFAQYSALGITVHLPPTAHEPRPSQLPFFLVMANPSWHPVPVWVGPRMVQIPEDISQLPLRPEIELTEYDLLTELDEHWEPTTAKAKARVHAMERYLALGGTFNEWMLPMVPVPAWVAVLRQRLARGDTAVFSMLVQMGAMPPVDEVLGLLKATQGPAREKILQDLTTVDPTPYLDTIHGMLNGRYANDASLLDVLGAAGVVVDPAKLNYSASEITAGSRNNGYQLLCYCRNVGIKAPDGLVDSYLRNDTMHLNCGVLLSEAQKDSLKKILVDEAEPARVRFHARCLLLLAGDKTQEEELMKFVPPGTPYQNGYNSGNLDEYIRGTLDFLASDGLFPSRRQSLLKHELFDSETVGPGVHWVLMKGATPEEVAEVVQKLDDKFVANIAWQLGDWNCRAAVPKLVSTLDALDYTEESQYDFDRVVGGLRTLADPFSGPCLVRALEKIEKTNLHMTPETRIRVLDGLMRMGAGFPEGKQTLQRVIASERRYSVFRMMALAGMARQSPDEGLAMMLKEVEAAPPTALPMLLKLLTDTRLPGIAPTLKKHLNNRYPPAAMAAAVGMLSLGESSALPVIHNLRWRSGRHNNEMQSALMAYWKPDTPPEHVSMIRACLDAYSTQWISCETLCHAR